MALLDRLKGGQGAPIKAAKKRLDIRSRFEVLREPYPGRKSKVYLARDKQSGEQVAIKVLDAKKAAEFEARFKGLNKPSEGEIAAQFNHPYVCRTIEFGTTTEGAPYLIMEPLGAALNTILGVGPDAIAGRRLKYLAQVGEALDVVHKAGILHRDVCPRNLLFTEDGETLKLTDFGMAVPATGRFLEPGNRTGTPAYMAPELVRLHKTDQRLDIFAFGVIAYEMFAATSPWPGESGGSGAVWHTSQPTDLREHCPEIHPSLAEAIMKCVQPDLSKRCPSMTHFLTMLRRAPRETAE